VGPTDPDQRVGVFSLTHSDLPPQDLAAVLETEYGILTRAGLHCAPRAHATMGTRPEGTLRISFGPFNTADDVARVARALAEIGAAAAGSRPLTSPDVRPVVRQ
jgi:selenocysteine lyase/cysteine desulfurase